jgi:uncharacterized membrane protein YfcA
MPELRGDTIGLMAAIGFASGVAGGLLGIGGGGVMVPLLVAFAGVAQRNAHAVSLGAVVPLALAAAITYGAADEVRLDMALALFAGGAVGAPVGAWLLSRADDQIARRAFGILLLATSGYLFLS